MEAELRHFWGALIGWTGLAVVVGVVLGWLLQEMSGVIRGRRDNRKAIGRALSTLLDVRGVVTFPGIVIKELRGRGMPPEAEPMARKFFTELHPRANQLSQEYNASLDELAGSYPVLAFQLRSKDIIGSGLRQFSSIVPNEKAALTWFASLENELLVMTLPRLDDAIRLLARKHGLLTRWNVRKELADHEVPGELKAFLDRMIASAPRNESGGTPDGSS